MFADSIPTTQSAWLVVRRGAPHQSVVFKKDVPVSSKLNKDEVLVKVRDPCMFINHELRNWTGARCGTQSSVGSLSYTRRPH